jgi:soluble lytic murein transglycosylase-like protein
VPFRPPRLKAGLAPFALLPLIAVFEDGRTLKVDAFTHPEGAYVLALAGGGRLTVPEDRLAAIVDDELAPGPPPPLPPALAVRPFEDRYGALVVPYGDLLAREARAHDLNPLLLSCVMQVESAGNPYALSPRGAMGLMQLMPGTAARFGVKDPWDPEQSIRGASRYLRSLSDRFQGRADYVLAAYNCGEVVVERHAGVPPYRETRDYVRKVTELYLDQASRLPR